jgi:NAD(P)-dependent dehydrogenase (short-subunit alcohol dehydrogenase family)
MGVVPDRTGVNVEQDLAGERAIVTGAGSGIGAALTRRLVAAGAAVVAADIDEGRAAAVVASCSGPGTVVAARLDVADADAVRDLVANVAAEPGGLAMMFNNAGIGVGGNTEDLSVADWNRVIDVNLRGVVHGVAAAYPVMVRQGRGHIVNTASLAGLLPAGLLTVYSTTKHAVVGMSLSLRAEAAARGVKVLVVCPSAVETAILDPNDGRGGFDVRRYVTTDQGVKTPLAPAALAEEIMNAMRKDRAVLVTPRSARIAWYLNRLSPTVGLRLGRRVVNTERRQMGS